ncbi:MAG: tetratricopeptide repeat protein [Cytophagaceae bacterium]|nr:MAG: tetratricopeptide repeat protein [Cytophagaceae bacterium]
MNKVPMNKSLRILPALLCVTLAPMGLTQVVHAQPAQLSYSQLLTQTKQDFDGKNYEVAAKDAQKLLDAAQTPDETSQALLTLGETFYLRKMYEPARAQWNKLLDLPEDPEDRQHTSQTLVHLNLARSYTAQGNFAKAIPHYKAGLALFDQEDEKTPGDKAPDVKGQEPKSENPKALAMVFSLALANAYYHTQQYDLAQQQLGQIIASTPQNVPAILLLALTRSSEIDFVQFQLKKSVTGFQQVLDLAVKEDAPLTQKYAQDQVQWGKLLIQTNWEGGGAGNLKMDLRNNANDLRMNSAIQGLNDAVLDALLLETLSDSEN